MAHQLPTETEIDATPATVWTVLTELATLPDRTLFRTSSEGEVVDGARRPESLRAGSGRGRRSDPSRHRARGARRGRRRHLARHQ